MDPDEVEKKIEAARIESERQKQTKEFLESLKKGDDLVKPIYNPEAFVMREKAKGAAARGEIKKNNCRHPDAYLQQYLDTDPSTQRRGLPTNLYVCGVCNMLLWLVDPWGTPKPDG